jgi:hypothetical protein
MEAEGLLNTRVVFDGEIVEIFQAARSVVRVPLADIRDVRLEQGRRWTEMTIDTGAGRVLTPDRRPLPIAFNSVQLPAAHALVGELSDALREPREGS